jgi:hypothetical protein
MESDSKPLLTLSTPILADDAQQSFTSGFLIFGNKVQFW